MLAQAIHGNPLFESGDPRPALLVEQHGAPCSPGLDPTGAVAADTNGRALTIRPSVPNLPPQYLGSPQIPVGIQRKRRRGLLKPPPTHLSGPLPSGLTTPRRPPPAFP